MQAAKFGPPSYRGAPRLYRLQAWVSQPAQSIQLFGLLAADPASLYIYRGYRGDYLNPLLGLSYTKEAAATPDALLENEDLRQMVFPSTSIAATPARLFPGCPLRIAARSPGAGGRLARPVRAAPPALVDRYPHRSPACASRSSAVTDFDLLLSDNQVTELALDQNNPPEQLALAMQKIQSAPSTPIPGAASTPSSSCPPPPPPFAWKTGLLSVSEPSPPGYDPRSRPAGFRISQQPGIQQRFQRHRRHPGQPVRRWLPARRHPLRSALDAALRPLARWLAAGLQHLQRRRLPP